MKKLFAASAALALIATPMFANGAGASRNRPAEESGEQEFVVLYTEGASLDQAHAAIAAAGGTIVSENTDVGVATVVTTNSGFTEAAAAQSAIDGTAENRVIGEAPQDVANAGEVGKADPAEDEGRIAGGAAAKAKATTATATAKNVEPLADLQWDMKQIGATATGSYKYEQGKGVLVGIIDTGVDGSHPDIAPNFDAALSRNFTVDVPYDADGNVIDGPCEEEPDQSCNDPADVDEDGHGTHVASTIAGAINGIGIAGVAPQATIVNLRAGQDSGYFFLQPSIDALTYAANVGIDVVNMSYYVDPWLFNCSANPADSPADQEEQQTIVKAMQRALTFARNHGVTLVSAAGNGATDYTKVITDGSSPDFASEPGEAPYTRTIDPADCTSMPSEGKGVITVSSTGQSTRKAYYSDYGNGYIDVAAPGGDAYDTPDNTLSYPALVLAAYPKALAIANGEIDANGDPVVPWVVKSCTADNSTCAYYQYLQGTSMASPHAAGVVALIVGKYGIRDWAHGGKFLPADVTEWVLKATATKTPCPTPPAYTYTRYRPGQTVPVVTTHVCEGTKSNNGFYGSGIVSATRALGH